MQERIASKSPMKQNYDPLRTLNKYMKDTLVKSHIYFDNWQKTDVKHLVKKMKTNEQINNQMRQQRSSSCISKTQIPKQGKDLSRHSPVKPSKQSDGKVPQRYVNYMNQTTSQKKMQGAETFKDKLDVHQKILNLASQLSGRSKSPQSSISSFTTSFMKHQQNSQFRLPKNELNYYVKCFPDQYIIHSINNRMNNYDEFHHVVRPSKYKESFAGKFTYFKSTNNYECVYVEESRQSLTQQSSQLPLNESYEHLKNLQHLHESIIMNQIYKENFLESPRFTKSIAQESNIKLFKLFEKYPGDTGDQNYQYDYQWELESSDPNRKRPPRISPRVRKRIFDDHSPEYMGRGSRLSSSKKF